MYNLECRSTEQNSWTGPGLAAPTRTLTHKHKIEMLQSTDPNPTKVKSTPNRMMMYMQPSRQYAAPECFSKESQNLQKLTLVILP